MNNVVGRGCLISLVHLGVEFLFFNICFFCTVQLANVGLLFGLLFVVFPKVLYFLSPFITIYFHFNCI